MLLLLLLLLLLLVDWMMQKKVQLCHLPYIAVLTILCNLLSELRLYRRTVQRYRQESDAKRCNCATYHMAVLTITFCPGKCHDSFCCFWPRHLIIISASHYLITSSSSTTIMHSELCSCARCHDPPEVCE